MDLQGDDGRCKGHPQDHKASRTNGSYWIDRPNWSNSHRPAGATGPAGAAGPGVPTGGTANQVLAKVDGTNYNTQWVTPGGIQLVTETAKNAMTSASNGTLVYQTDQVPIRHLCKRIPDGHGECN
ncbi:MAG: hypothetical protein IPN46_19665 [Saprospiraceae bacterium]|nr:hypothetical protein [Saprospiraceae bacterium]